MRDVEERKHEEEGEDRDGGEREDARDDGWVERAVFEEVGDAGERVDEGAVRQRRRRRWRLIRWEERGAGGHGECGVGGGRDVRAEEA